MIMMRQAPYWARSTLDHNFALLLPRMHLRGGLGGNRRVWEDVLLGGQVALESYILKPSRCSVFFAHSNLVL